MLNNEIRQRLQQLMTHYGHSVLDEPKRCEALLRDFFPEHKRELNLLVLSLREGIPQQLLKPAPHVGMDFTLQRLARTLHDDLGMVEQFAFWAVESWALSLRVIQQPMTQTTQPQILQPTPQIIQPTVQNKPEWRDPITSMEFVWIPAGSFMMGSPENEVNGRSDEKQHHVTIQQGFYLGKYLVTQAQWQAVMGNNPSYFKGANLPVEHVSWLKVQDFIQKFNHKSGQLYRLPTEAEWEYACRAGTITAYYTGNTISTAQANFGDNVGQATPAEPWGFFGESTPVGSYPPNPWGLYDMAGNVWEWTASIYDKDYRYSEQASKSNDTNSSRVLRGGCRHLDAEYTRSAQRYNYGPGLRSSFIAQRLGFRLSLCQIASSK